jgi:hypothetical protein
VATFRSVWHPELPAFEQILQKILTRAALYFHPLSALTLPPGFFELDKWVSEQGPQRLSERRIRMMVHAEMFRRWMNPMQNGDVAFHRQGSKRLLVSNCVEIPSTTSHAALG